MTKKITTFYNERETLVEKQKIELLTLLKQMRLFVPYGEVTIELIAGDIKFATVKDRRKLD